VLVRARGASAARGAVIAATRGRAATSRHRPIRV